MAEFKVGDRVRIKADAEVRLAGHEGVLEERARDYPFGFRTDNGDEHAVKLDEIELVEPRTGAPKVGDVVRVVLEGKLDRFWDDAFDIGGEEPNTIWPGADHVKSVEILKPARPSVADLPAHSVVRVGPDVFVRAGANHWYAAGRSTLYSDAELDGLDWTLLVEKSA